MKSGTKHLFFLIMRRLWIQAEMLGQTKANRALYGMLESLSNTSVNPSPRKSLEIVCQELRVEKNESEQMNKKCSPEYGTYC